MDNQEMDYTYSEIEEFIINYKSNSAVKLLVSLLNNNKSDVEILFEKAMIYYYVESDLKRTLKELNHILKIDSDFTDALLLKGEILAGIHKYGDAIKTLNNIHPKILPYGYKKLIEYVSEYNHRHTVYYSVFDFDSYWVYFYIEGNTIFRRLSEKHIDILEYKVFENGLIWQDLDTDYYKSMKETVPIISGIRLFEEEPGIESINVNIENCVICGKKINTNQKNLCKSCMKKQYASRIIKKLVSVVKPEIVFKKQDLKSLNLDDIQIQDYIWTLQEFDLIEVDNNKLKLKDKVTLNDFRIESKMDPIDFDRLKEENRFDKTCKTCGKTLPISHFYKSSEGYEDNCKICKKHIVTAGYLVKIIEYIGFDNEFDESALNIQIPNKNQIMGMIWSLQDNDLLIEKDDKTYILANKSKCLDFLHKYNPNYEFNETDIKPKSKAKRKSKSKSKDSDDLKKSKIESEQINRAKFKKDSKLPNGKNKQMKTVLNERKKGKSREEAANIAGIPLSKITHWYERGKEGLGKDNISFYRKLKKIENDLSNSIDLNERKQMNFVLKLLRQGKSLEKIAEVSEIKESTITSWCHQGKEKYSKNTIYFLFEVQKIKETNKKKIEAKNLKVQLKELIPKFIELDEKIVETNINSSELNSIRGEIKSNIEILKSSSRLRRIDKLENRLVNAEKSYKLLYKKFKEEIIKINKHNNSIHLKKLSNEDIEEIIKENIRIITVLRNKFAQDNTIKNKLTEISFLNSKFNSNFKNEKNVELDDLLNVRNSLIEIMIDLDYCLPSENTLVKNSTDTLNKSTNIKNRVDENKELLDFLFSITGSNYSSLKVSFISSLVFNNLTVKEGMEIRDVLVNEIDDGMLKTPDQIKQRMNDLIYCKSGEVKEHLLEFLYDITGSSNSLKLSFVRTLELYNLSVEEGMEIRDVLVNEIDDGNLKNQDEIRSKLYDLIKQKRRYNKRILLEFLYDITGRSNSLKLSYVKTLELNNLSVVEGMEIRNVLVNKIDNGKLKTQDEIRFNLENLIKQYSDKLNDLINYLYSLTDDKKINSLSIKSTFDYLGQDELNKINEKIEKEIQSKQLTSKKDIQFRFDEQVSKKKKEKCNILLEEFYEIVGDDNNSNSFLEVLSQKGLTPASGIYIRNVVEKEIKNYSIKKMVEIDSEINNIMSDEISRQDKSLNKLNELYINDNIYLKGLSLNEKDEVKKIVVKSIKENRLNYFDVYLELKKVIEEFKKTKNIDDSQDSKNKDSNENKSSNGFISKLKRFFSLK